MFECLIYFVILKVMEDKHTVTPPNNGAESSPTNQSPESLRPRIQRERSPNSICAVCLGTRQNPCFSDGCLHEFCFECLRQWSQVKHLDQPVSHYSKRHIMTIFVHLLLKLKLGDRQPGLFGLTSQSLCCRFVILFSVSVLGMFKVWNCI